MQYVVIRAFQDKFTKVHFPKESAYESSDSERVEYLQSEGFLGEAIPGTESQEADPGIKHVGGGYYELPNGEKVKGKDAAQEALKALGTDIGDQNTDDKSGTSDQDDSGDKSGVGDQNTDDQADTGDKDPKEGDLNNQ